MNPNKLIGLRAKFASKCKECGKQIEIGEDIALFKLCAGHYSCGEKAFDRGFWALTVDERKLAIKFSKDVELQRALFAVEHENECMKSVAVEIELDRAQAKEACVVLRKKLQEVEEDFNNEAEAAGKYMLLYRGADFRFRLAAILFLVQCAMVAAVIFNYYVKGV